MFLFLEPMNLLEQVTSFLTERGAVAYLVGGSVRDQLLGRALIRDVDISVAENAASLARAFANTQGGAFYLMDAEHDVARVILEGAYVDFARLRGDLRSDLATRDFTINAMARPLGPTAVEYAGGSEVLTSGIADPFHGMDDLAARRIRAVSDAGFEQDPVRILRAIRFANELQFAIEPHTETLLVQGAGLLSSASPERARDEFFKILALPEPARWLTRMDEIGLVKPLLPELDALRKLAQPEPHHYDALEHSLRTLGALERIQTAGYGELANGQFLSELQAHFAKPVSAGRTRAMLLRYVALLHDVGKAATRSADETGLIHFYEHETRGAEMIEQISLRLRLSNEEIALAKTITRNHLRPAQLAREPHLSDRAVYRFFRDTGDAGVDVCALALADLRGKSVCSDDAEQDVVLRSALALLLDRFYRARDTVISPPRIINGRTLIRELGLAPGPEVGKTLEAIREAQAEGSVRSAEDALVYAREMISRDQAHGGSGPRAR